MARGEEVPAGREACRMPSDPDLVEKGGASMPLDHETLRLLKIWGVKIAGSAYLLFVFAFMAGHPQPGSMASLSYALSLAIVPAAVATLAVLGVMVFLHKR